MKIIKCFIFINKDKLLSNFKIIKFKDIKFSGKDFDFIDKKFSLRTSFQKILTKKKLIFFKRYHKTGLRYDVIDNKFNVYSLDFLNGVEYNPIFYNLYNKPTNKKIKSLKFKLNYKNLLIICNNFFSFFMWRINSIKNQSLTSVEFLGVDGSGKSFYASKLYNNIHKFCDVQINHLWKKKNTKVLYKTHLPYQKKNYLMFKSILKDIYINFNIIIFIIKEFFFYKNKKLLIFERSLWDIHIDPSRYRLKYKSFLTKFILNFFLKNSHMIFLDKSFKTITKRKNELNIHQYKDIKKKINSFFKSKHKYYNL